MEILICILAGLGAGVTTGLAGLSAASFIVPILVSLLKMPTYEAVSIALASDVLASAVSAVTYAKHGNTDFKRSRLLFILVVVIAIIGSIVAKFVTTTEIGNTVTGYLSIIVSLMLGIRLLTKKDGPSKAFNLNEKWQTVGTVLAGTYIGFVCGFQGTGGGMMLLIVLTELLRMDFKVAVGTSVTIMAVTAFIGSVSHYIAIGHIDDWQCLVTCIVSTLVFARLAAVLANRIKNRSAEIITGVILAIFTVAMLIFKLFS